MPGILLSHGYFLEDDAKEQKIMRPYPPLGLLYVSAWLRKHGLHNEVYDTTFSNQSKWLDHLENRQPDYLCLYVNLMTRPNILKLLAWSTRHLPHTILILGGPEVRHHAAALLQAGAHFIVVGEGEQTCLELIEYLQAGKPYDDISGIVFTNKQGDIQFNPEREKLKDLDLLPLPARDLIDMSQYLQAWKKAHGQNAISVNTMRGCPYTCKWCSRAVYGLSYRRRSVQHVVDELIYLKNTYNPDSLWFVDDVFTVSHKWLEAFAEEVTQRGAVIPFECITRADRMNEEVIKLLVKSGCFRVWIGAESGSQRVIDAMDRRVDVAQVGEMIRQSRAAGLQAGTFIMLGYPGETLEDIDATIKHLQTSQPDHFTITVAYPIKGTALYAEVEEHLSGLDNYQVQTDRDLDFRRTYSKDFYPYAVRYVVNSVMAVQKSGLKALWHRLKAAWAKHRMQRYINQPA